MGTPVFVGILGVWEGHEPDDISFTIHSRFTPLKLKQEVIKASHSRYPLTELENIQKRERPDPQIVIMGYANEYWKDFQWWFSIFCFNFDKFWEIEEIYGLE